MQVDFALVAQGDVTLPTINHMITATTLEHAKSVAMVAVGALSRAGYHRFTLYNTKRQNAQGADFEVARFKAFQPAIEVTSI